MHEGHQIHDDEIEGAIVAISEALKVDEASGTPEFTEAVQRRIDVFENLLRWGIEAGIAEHRETPLRHTFTPGLYAREITMPRGAVVVSKIHKTEHPYVVSKGKCRVFIEGVGWQTIQAPHFGITKPMTRRVLVILEDTVWATFHPTDKKTVDEVETEIIFPRKQLQQEDQK